LRLVFAEPAWEDYLHWQENDRRFLARVNKLLEERRGSPFRFMGKPEPLKGGYSGWWSRRITNEHRLVYRIVGKAPDQALDIAQGRYHHEQGRRR
jgi:toxin YoeB